MMGMIKAGKYIQQSFQIGNHALNVDSPTHRYCSVFRTTHHRSEGLKELTGSRQQCLPNLT